jgi:hypothetical protein
MAKNYVLHDFASAIHRRIGHFPAEQHCHLLRHHQRFAVLSRRKDARHLGLCGHAASGRRHDLRKTLDG